jgi:8-oxo-dGTP pyrophosphatase MutT (NUDIX family)
MPISAYLRGLRARVGRELLLVPSVTALVFDEKARLLLVRHVEGDLWVAPGGSIDPHETPADAVVREVWEETGLLVEPVRLLSVYGGPEFEVVYQIGDRVSYVMTVFECRVIAGTPRADGVETLELGYFSLAELRDLRLPRWARMVLPDAFAPGEQTYFQPARWRPPAHGIRPRE